MSRNGSGVYSLSDTIAPSDPQSSTVLMAILQDIAAALSGSIASDGQTPITGALKGADGTASLPAYSFASDPNTGVYRIAADVLGIACGGAEIARLTTSGLTMATGKGVTVGGAAVTAIPSGVICMWSGSVATIPTGWHLCDGNNSTPDLRDKFIIGAASDDSGTAKSNVTGSLTQTGGSKDAIAVTHTHTASSVVTDPGHDHSIPVWQGGSAGSRPLLGAANVGSSPSTNDSTTGITVATTINNAGSSGTDANLPPYYALAFIMKA